MSSLSAAQCEQIAGAAFEAVRERFQRALDTTTPAGNALVAFDTELHVDQVRRLTTSIAWDDSLWRARDGKYCIATTTRGQVALLSLCVGPERYATAEMVFLLLCDVIAGKRVRGGESNVAGLVNLLIVEPYLYPERGLAIWVTVAHRLATAAAHDELHAILPPLSTEFDVLHAELPAIPLAAKLRPDARRAGSVPSYQAGLLAAVRPDLAPAIAALGSDDERAQLWSTHEPALRAYVRDELYGRVATAVAAAKDRYVEPLQPG